MELYLEFFILKSSTRRGLPSSFSAVESYTSAESMDLSAIHWAISAVRRSYGRELTAFTYIIILMTCFFVARLLSPSFVKKFGEELPELPTT